MTLALAQVPAVEVTGLTKVFSLFDSVDDAVASA